jgi:dynein heavy chain
VRAHVASLEVKLAELSRQFEDATNEKNEAIAQAERTQTRANMADRLVNGLADEKVPQYVHVIIIIIIIHHVDFL